MYYVFLRFHRVLIHNQFKKKQQAIKKHTKFGAREQDRTGFQSRASNERR